MLAGQPFPIVDERVPLHELPSLDIYNDHFPMRMPGVWELKHWPDFVEVTSFSTGTFPAACRGALAVLARAAVRQATPYSQLASEGCLRMEPALRSRTRNVA